MGEVRRQAVALAGGYTTVGDEQPRKDSLRLSHHYRMVESENQQSEKGPLRVTMVAGTAESGPEMASGETQQLSSEVTTEETLGLRVAPILRKNPVSGKLEIGNFEPLVLSGDSEQCVNMGYSMLGDAKSSSDLLDIMIATDEITIAKICAANGSIVLTCRNDQIAVSPRPARPDDKCQRAG